MSDASWRRLATIGAVLVLAASCASREDAHRPPRITTTAATDDVAEAGSARTDPPSTDTVAVVGSAEPITDDIAARMSASWRPGCPVGFDSLRLLAVTHWGFDGKPRRGELVVHADHADGILQVFRTLYEQRFPIEQMRLVDEFGGDDDRSMAANNTSAFNCRRATGSSAWSEHAHGRAIDINPVQNPYVTSSGKVLPPAGRAHTDRRSGATGMVTADGPVVAAFRAIRWGWGGGWSLGKDYQHFSATGR